MLACSQTPKEKSQFSKTWGSIYAWTRNLSILFCSKVCWFEPYTIFSGGMPRASYGDRHCISVICGDSTQATFDFTSRVVDFFIIFDKHDKSKKGL